MMVEEKKQLFERREGKNEMVREVKDGRKRRTNYLRRNKMGKKRKRGK